MKYLNIFDKLKQSRRVNDENIIMRLTESINYTQAQLTTYINKYLKNEEKWKQINYLIQSINSTLEIDELLKVISSKIAKLADADLCKVFLYDDSIKALINRLDDESPQEADVGYMQNFIKTKNTLLPKYLCSIEEISLSHFKDFLNEGIHRNYNIIPIINDSEFFGIIFLYKKMFILTSEEINIIEIIAKNISMAIRNADLYEKLKESNKNKLNFIASLSHEFKTPLNSIIGLHDIIKANSNMPKELMNNYLKNIMNSSSHLLRLIEDIQDISIAESGYFSVHYEKFNTKPIITDIVSQLTTIASEQNIKINAKLVDTSINADPKRFKQVVYNLLGNAIKFSFKDQPIEIFSYLDDNNFHFEITNTGKVITTKDKEKIFRLFYQEPFATHSNYKGAGIGLAICKKIISQLGGDISFKSDKDSRTTFFFSIPISPKKCNITTLNIINSSN